MGGSAMAAVQEAPAGEAGRTREMAPWRARGVWRTEVALRVRELRHRLDAADEDAFREGHDGDGGEEAVGAEADAGGVDATVAELVQSRVERRRRSKHIRAAEQALRDATKAIELERRWPGRIHDWWTGQMLTAAWEAVHQAEAELVEIGSDADALVTLPRLRAWMRQVLADKRHLREYEKRFDTWVNDRGASPDRTVLRQAYEDAISGNIEWYCSLRAFRNMIFLVAAGLLVLLVGLGLWHALNPNVVSLCETMNNTQACFGGGGGPAPWTIFGLELVGAVGGLLSGAFLLGRLKRPPSRYNVLVPQMLLKVVAGAAAAAFGVLLVQAQAGIESTTVLLAYAGLFGFSQQLLTRFVDERGDDLLKPQPGGNDAKTAEDD
jgi:hypothetical protein